MSDLQCPATVVLITPETVTSNDLARILTGRRLSGIIVASCLEADSREFAAAQRFADHHACRLDLTSDIVDSASLMNAMSELADLYRGETIALMATSSMIGEAFNHTAASSRPMVIAIDADGWTAIGN